MFMALAANVVSTVINESGTFTVSRSSSSDCYAGIRLNADGSADGNNNDGSASFASPVGVDDWWTSGPKTVYVERTIVSGLADWIDDIGTGRVALSTSPRIGCVRTTSFGADTVAVTFNFYAGASGGSAIGTISNVGITAAKVP